MVEIIQAIFEFIVEIFLVWTGEIILYVVTLGKHKPRWNLYTDERPVRFVLFSELSCWLGGAFWIIVIIILAKVL